MNGTSHSFAMAFASMVLPVPGGPWNNTFFGAHLPYLSESCRYLSIIRHFCFAASWPTISFNVMSEFLICKIDDFAFCFFIDIFVEGPMIELSGTAFFILNAKSGKRDWSKR